VIGLLSLALAIGYTGGPYPLAYHGLGDIFVLIFFGFVATAGTVWVQGLLWSTEALWAGGAIGLLATSILVVNNLRDRVTDAAADKRTLAVRFGARAARWEHSLCIGGAFVVVALAPLVGLGGWGWWLPWLALPLAINEIRAIWSKDGAALNPHLGGAARLELVFGVLLSAGVILG
jgi:1,4-dihydroxy-2-naphthoate octaprenyltransferase